MKTALANLADSPDFRATALEFFRQLGYQSPRAFDFEALSFVGFTEALGGADVIDETRALGRKWRAAHLLFQFTADELDGQTSLLSETKNDLFEAFIFVALNLEEKSAGESYSRTQLASIARGLNKPFASPVIVLFRHGQTATLASVARREHKIIAGAHVLQKVSLLKDIRLQNPHGAHLKILADLKDAQSGTHNWSEFLARCWLGA